MEEMIFQQRDSEMSYKKGLGLRMVYDSTRYAIVTTRVPFALNFLGYHAQGSSPWTVGRGKGGGRMVPRLSSAVPNPIYSVCK